MAAFEADGEASYAVFSTPNQRRASARKATLGPPELDNVHRNTGRKEGTAMKARVGDRLVVKGHHVGQREREALILEVRGAAGAPPYVVRWSEDGHEGLVFPGPDAYVQPSEHGGREG
jgi:hypothetical protein